MKHIVTEINIFTNSVLAIHEFDNADDAIDWAWQMNEALEATPIRYKYSTKPEAVEIEMDDNIPGQVIPPMEIPEREIPEDWDI